MHIDNEFSGRMKQNNPMCNTSLQSGILHEFHLHISICDIPEYVIL